MNTLYFRIANLSIKAIYPARELKTPSEVAKYRIENVPRGDLIEEAPFDDETNTFAHTGQIFRSNGRLRFHADNERGPDLLIREKRDCLWLSLTAFELQGH